MSSSDSWCLRQMSLSNQSSTELKLIHTSVFNYLMFVCFVALHPKSTAMVMAGRSVHLTTLFPEQA